MNVLLAPTALIIGLAIGFFIARSMQSANIKSALYEQSEVISQLKLDLSTSIGAKNAINDELQTAKAELSKTQSTNLTIAELKEKVGALETASASLTGLIGKDSAFQSQISSISENTASLSKSLSMSQKRGSIGEAQLEILFKQAGLLPGVHYETQFTMDLDGKALRPDVKIELMDGNVVYIDSKFPFSNFSRALATQDTIERAALMKEHAADLLTHAKKLGAKNYSTSEDSLPYVILFAPVENLLYEALEADPDLINKMSKENVTIATPATMMALLHTIHHLFSRTQFANNLKAFDKLATQLVSQIQVVHKKIVTLAEKFEASEEALNELVKSTGTRLFKPANEMLKLGARSGTLDKNLSGIEEVHVEIKRPKAITSSLFAEELDLTENLDESQEE
jgi:DNA recombination protein RmuC